MYIEQPEPYTPFFTEWYNKLIEDIDLGVV